jgi:FdhD protein
MLNETDTEKSGWCERSVVRHRGGASESATDSVAEEWPVALVFNGISHAVMMTTPRDLEAFAVGFALTEGIVEHGHDIQDIEVQIGDDSAAVHLTIVQQAFVSLKDKRRALAGRTGCGVCGIESIELLDLAPEVVGDHGLLRALAPDAVQQAAHQLPAHQTLMRATGGVHAAAWCDAQGTVRFVFEDVGRHNALDKLIGHLVLQREDLSKGFVFMSSRASYELVRKAARMDIAMLATISAPSSLAIRIAEKAAIRLVSFCREQGYVEYATGHAQRSA